MFIGHFAPALLAATRKDAPSLPLLFIAAQLVDWIFFGLLIAGVEKARMSPGISKLFHVDLYHMPFTHSLLGGAIWAVALGTLYWCITRHRSGAWLIAIVVLSHWFLDVLVHVPDMTVAGQPPKLGLGLWNHPANEIPLELVLTFGALWLYARAKHPARAPLLILGAIMLLLQLVQWFGPIEPEITIFSSLLAFFAFGAITLASWWVARRVEPQ
jgi:hypothetical protein